MRERFAVRMRKGCRGERAILIGNTAAGCHRGSYKPVWNLSLV